MNPSRRDDVKGPDTLDDAAPVLVGTEWRASLGVDTFTAVNPVDFSELGRYPLSPWIELDQALVAAVDAYQAMAELPPDSVATFLERFAERLETGAEAIANAAHLETALAIHPRLADIELPRTTDQIRQAARVSRERSWRNPVISTEARIAAFRSPIPGAVCVFGPNNFPLAFNSVGGGDFAAAIATGHPVIAKANPGHPGTTRLLAAEAHAAAAETGIPPATIQMVYRTSHEDGARLVSDPRIAATAYTGSRRGGLALKTAADAAGKPIYLEMSSVNPVVVLPSAIQERAAELADELVASMLAGTGQFCTSPGLIFTLAGTCATRLVTELGSRIEAAPSGTLLGATVRDDLVRTRRRWEDAGARVAAEAGHSGSGWSVSNAILTIDGEGFLANPEVLQEEAFGNYSMLVVAADMTELQNCLGVLEGSLTGTIYGAADDEDGYQRVERLLRPRVGRLLNDKVPTGVAVVAAMNHGGPFPSTGHPGFTAVGMPASFDRFTLLQSYDNVPDRRLPAELKAANPLGLQRLVDGRWTTEPLG